MKLNKVLIKIGTFLSISTLVTGFVLVLINTNNNQMIDFWINVSLAIFGSSVVMVFTSIWGYFSERKKYEIQYATFSRNFLLRVIRFLDVYTDKKANPSDVYNITSDIHSLYDCYAYEKNYEIFGYFLKKGQKYNQIKTLQKAIDECATEISRIESLARNSIHKNEKELIFKTTITNNFLENTTNIIENLFGKNQY